MPQRAANTVDFWRGVALASIFINHIPGFFYERFTSRNFGISDSAELFVFLAGWSVRNLAGQRDTLTMTRMMLRVGSRAVELYAAQIAITMLAIALIAAAGLIWANPLLLDWHNAAAVFLEPVPTHIGLVLLTHQLGFFDILPLYVVLMFGAIVLAVVHRLAPLLILPVSLAIYLAAHVFRLNIPTWPLDGEWMFNPFCWQLIFVTGFVLAGPEMLALTRKHSVPLRFLGWIAAIGGLTVVIFNWWPDPLNMPDPALLFVIDKSYLSPLRYFHALGIIALFAGIFPLLEPKIPRIAAYFCMLGRNSLYVFCVGSLLSLIGQLARFRFGGNLGTDTIVLVLGLFLLGLTAWLSELRARLKDASPPRPAAPG